jgi:hypothetical protein
LRVDRGVSTAEAKYLEAIKESQSAQLGYFFENCVELLGLAGKAGVE